MTRLFAASIILFALCSSIATAAPDSYVLGPEDGVTITVLRHPEFSGEFLIPTDGLLNLPGVGQLQAGGKTLTEFAGAIAQKLSDRLNNPEVSVALKTQREQRIYVLGSVTTSGVYDYKPGWRITEALACAGGVEGEVADCEVSVLSAGTGMQQDVKMEDVLAPDSKANLPLEPGDVVSVHTVKLLPVYVIGQVKKPGMYPLREGGGIMEAIALAEGALDNAAMSRVTITHVSGKTETIDLIPAMQGKQEENRKLEPGDLVVVPESDNRFAVLGYVNNPGYYTAKEGQPIKLSDALGLAGGNVVKKSSLDSILVLRTKDGKQEKLMYNLSDFLKDGNAKGNPEILAGDVVYVPRSSSPDWDAIVRAISSASLVFNALYP